MTTPDQPHLLDVNVLIALAWPSHVHHRAAHDWLGSRMDMPFLTCPTTESAFLRLSTNPRVVGTRVPFLAALDVLRRIRALSGHTFLPDASTLAEPSIDLGRVVVSAQVTDIHLVNLAAGSGAVLVTFDRKLPSFLAPDDTRHVLVLT